MASPKDMDLYGTLEIDHQATDKEILKAYRKKALKVHPDKNPDNPQAADLFHELTKALEVLTDPAARAAYDKAQKAKKATELRHKELNSKRKKFKEDLERREAASQDNRVHQDKLTRSFQQEIARLRKEGSRLVEEEKERLLEVIKKEREKAAAQIETLSAPGARLKIKWKAKKSDENNGGYNREVLTDIFEKYGEVTALLVSKSKNGSAIVEFSQGHSAVQAEQVETGLSDNPLTLSWLSGNPTEGPAESGMTPDRDATQKEGSEQRTNHAQAAQSSDTAFECHDFESLVLRRMRQAEERRRLMEQLQDEDT